MNRRYQELQDTYLAELRSILPPILSWWKEHAVRPPAEMGTGGNRNDFERRWPLGPVAHPRVLAVLRTYYLAVLALNREFETLRPPQDTTPRESDWGIDDEEADVPFVLPIDLLVNDLESIAPDLYEIMSNLVFVPVGLAPDGEYC
ncbi:hypothetical protein EH240_20890 [Mesorhizobium tamadayense]|uniref:Uncharacterized protein n=1 Tax=Mesorhizobium tamadayense TaxID=425306 RepID=A0A3P3FFE6_9HYPH|nr:hypothetical protein [Mesorhizobium tamadayense]RRH97420.1 hypothetical protein EH240_20890 [Mesorhizobium tamadayense]